MQGGHSDGCRCSLTVLDTVLTVGELARAKGELAIASLAQEAS
jgi:hypothetical protein